MKKTSKLIAGVCIAAFMISGALAFGKTKAKVQKYGVLSYLNYSENDFTASKQASFGIIEILTKEKYVKLNAPLPKDDSTTKTRTVFFDTLDAMIMALMSGRIESIGSVPQTTALYLNAQNPSLMPLYELDWGKVKKDQGFSQAALTLIGDGFSFMMRDNQKSLCEEFNKAIASMQKDGTLDRMVEEYVLRYDNLKPIEIEQKPKRDTITIAVTGALPPFDYVAPDGTFAGFNTAFLAEVGKRIDKNIKLLQVSSIGRATALASGTADAVFWTRSSYDPSLVKMTEDEYIASIEKKGVILTERERNAIRNYLIALPFKKRAKIDMPTGTIVTNPYFRDIPVGVILKK
jgi:ABC-type amino acid transport substrate-binding protein